MSIRCGNCKGEGIVAGTRRKDGSIDTCPHCHGRGFLGRPPKQPKAPIRGAR